MLSFNKGRKEVDKMEAIMEALKDVKVVVNDVIGWTCSELDKGETREDIKETLED